MVHLARVSNDPMEVDFSDLRIAVNCDKASNAARFAEPARIKKFVFASSCSVNSIYLRVS